MFINGKRIIHNKIVAMMSMTREELCNRLAFGLFCVFMIDCSISGSGRWLMIGKLSFRMYAGFGALLLSVPTVLKKFRKWIRNPMIVILILFSAMVVVSAYIGWKNGNRVNLILSDIKGFGWLFLLVVALSVLTSKERIHFLMKCIVFASVMQALMVIIINVVTSISDEVTNGIFSFLLEKGVGFLSPLGPDVLRIFFRSNLYLIIGLLFIFYFQVVEMKRKFYFFYSALLGNAIMLTYTRSTYGATLVSFVLMFALYMVSNKDNNFRRSLVINICAVTVLTVLLLIPQQIIFRTNYIAYGFSRVLSTNLQPSISTAKEAMESIEEAGIEEAGIEEANGNNSNEDTYISDTVIRYNTKKELQAMIKKSPIWGNGLGAAIPSREDGLVEYFYYDILNKMGIIGIGLYLFPVMYMSFSLIVRRNKERNGYQNLLVIVFSGLFVFLSASYFNPYMNAVLGIAYYAMSIGIFNAFSSILYKEAYSREIV